LRTAAKEFYLLKHLMLAVTNPAGIKRFLPLPAAGFFFSKKKHFLPFANDF